MIKKGDDNSLPPANKDKALQDAEAPPLQEHEEELSNEMNFEEDATPPPRDQNKQTSRPFNMKKAGAVVLFVGCLAALIGGLLARPTPSSTTTEPPSLLVEWLKLGQDIDDEFFFDKSDYAVSLSSDGNTVAIGKNGNDGNGSDSGHVRVYRFNDKLSSPTWIQLGDDIDGENAGDKSGAAVSLSSDGNTVAIGALYSGLRVYRLDDKLSSPTWIQVGDDIDGENADDRLGAAVSLSSDGNTVAIGARENYYNGYDSGHVRVYRFNDKLSSPTWIQVGDDIDGENANDRSGWSVSLSSDGNTIAIGAPGNAVNGRFSGHVRVYRLDDKLSSPTWIQVGDDIDGENAEDRSGAAVSLSADGKIVAIGAPYNAGNGIYSGHVRVYRFNDKLSSPTWIQVGDDIDGEDVVDQSGWSVSLSSDGNTIAIGAPGNAVNGRFSGHVRVYRLDDKLSSPTWIQVGDDIDGENAEDRSGAAVSLSADGKIVAIGAPYNAGNGIYSGHVRVYRFNDKLSSPTWIQVGDDIDGEDVVDQSGWSVSLSSDGNTIAIGAPGNAVNGRFSGHVRVYRLDDKLSSPTWIQVGDDIDGENAEDRSGAAVSLSADGKIVAIGAPYNAGNGIYSGHVRVYRFNDKLSSPTWIQVGDDIDGEDVVDQSGWSVSLSSDGNTVAIGAYGNDGNGSDSGHVRVYRLDDNLSSPEWIQLGNDIDGENACDNSGQAVSLSSDGTTVAIGAPWNAGNGDYSGHVRLYRFDTE
ncbi:T9SS C-terminal target domain-containing protein [Chaetoceros tenuissimus]|uniref:T9SS C-terminal target domain-containing protein n=1 Tax=Chaetoceros tenuissimus TaxID=426638 RepID=A0AAD3HAK9_9STRA|nr:T9SS C-terminal target domain-containing protein [Chaetoceros tenuissimus]